MTLFNSHSKYQTLPNLKFILNILDAINILLKNNNDFDKLNEITDEIKNNSFINNIKTNNNFFNDLTRAIYWHEDLDTIKNIIQNNPNLINTVDKYNLTPLTLAIDTNNLKLVHYLINNGAFILARDHNSLLFFISNCIFFNPSIVIRLLEVIEAAPKLSGLDKLGCKGTIAELSGSIPRNINEENLIFKFSVSLEVLTIINKHISNYTFFAPRLDDTIFLLKEFIKTNPNINNQYSNILSSLEFAFNTSKFYGNIPDNLECIENIFKNLQNNLKKDNSITFIPGGFNRTLIGFTIIGDKLILTNRDKAFDDNNGTKIYKITKPELIDLNFIQAFMFGLVSPISPNYIYNKISKFIDPNPILEITQSINKTNSFFINLTSNIEGILAVLYNIDIANKLSRDFEKFIKDFRVNELTKILDVPNLEKPKKRHLSIIAFEQINQHHRWDDKDEINRDFKCKHALESLGLRSMYEDFSFENTIKSLLYNTRLKQRDIAMEVIEEEKRIAPIISKMIEEQTAKSMAAADDYDHEEEDED